MCPAPGTCICLVERTEAEGSKERVEEARGLPVDSNRKESEEILFFPYCVPFYILSFPLSAPKSATTWCSLLS